MGMFDELLDSGTEKNQADQKIPGVVTGLVKENWDEKHKGQLKVEYNLGEQGKNLTGWIPVMTPYGGKEFGSYFLPEVGSEVVIGFIMGDRNCPIVLGNIWSDKTPPPKEAPIKENTKKQLITKGGVKFLATEEKGKEELVIQLLDQLSLTFNAEKGLIQLGDKDKKNLIELDTKNGKLTLTAEKEIEIKTGSNASIKMSGSGGSVELTANKLVETGKQSAEITSKSTMKIEGMTTEVSAKGSMTVKSSGTTKISGTMVQLN